ncbi:hypothetical protein C8Q78DRAFT_26908 [Trametes maxima]|nr:hypothetical protein C8Q78DRAFT_26908 [Trametes maxima]
MARGRKKKTPTFIPATHWHRPLSSLTAPARTSLRHPPSTRPPDSPQKMTHLPPCTCGRRSS